VARAVRVCLVLEGSYPYVTGGVSAWVHQLIGYLRDVEFVLYTISPAAGQLPRYDLPHNVVGHTDLDLSHPQQADRKARRPAPRQLEALLSAIQEAHRLLLTGSGPSIEELVRRVPEGYSPAADAVASETGWRMLTSRNQTKNPAYPFADYFWAWKSAHDLMFAVLARPLPEADLYHAVSTGYAGLAALCAKIRRGRPYLLTEHGLYHKEREMEIRRTPHIQGYQRDMWIGIYNNLSRLSYRYADLIVALFEHNRRLQVELGAPQDKTRVIPNGIDAEYYRGVERRPRPGYHVGLVGRVVPIKDIKTFISTSKLLAETIPEARFYCIGPTEEDDAYYEDCRTLVQSLRLSDRFTFTGRADVREYYSFLDVLMLTSVREAQPLVILEAQCAGVPVVSTRVGNVAELLDFDERFLAPPKDPERLAAGVRLLHDNPQEAAALAVRARERVLRFYDRDAVFETYGDLYRRYAAMAERLPTATPPGRGVTAGGEQP
jgi:glycosyltransferase involved in cell wall biosynthesis